MKIAAAYARLGRELPARRRSDGTANNVRAELNEHEPLKGPAKDHRLGRASLIAGLIPPLPVQPSPFSSSQAKQLG
jgi:hypothetical protein